MSASPITAPSAYRLEPELRAERPRHVRLNGRAILVIVAAGLLLLIFVACGLNALGEAARLSVLSSRGVPTAATITEVRFSSSRPTVRRTQDWDADAAGEVDAVGYRYLSRDGVRHFATIPISTPTHRAMLPSPNGAGRAPFVMLPGKTLPILYAVIMGSTVSRVWTDSPHSRIRFLVAAGLAAVAVGLILPGQAILWLKRATGLVRHGEAVTAVVTEKDAALEDKPRFYIIIAFEDHEGLAHTKRIQCSAVQYQKFAKDEQLTVIYPAGSPSDAAVYAFLPISPLRRRQPN